MNDINKKLITDLTRKDIFKILVNGVNVDYFSETVNYFYPYYGILEEVEFLNRLYPLYTLESMDSRFDNAYDDIQKHSRFGDYEKDWIFKDERFNLKYCADADLLNFLCMIFHPEVRDEENKNWKIILDEINHLLKQDGYELYPGSQLSGRNIYSWKLYNNEKGIFFPFSQRNKKNLKSNFKKPIISREARYQIYNLFEVENTTVIETAPNGYTYDILATEKVFSSIRIFYIPKGFNENNEYVESENFKNFIYKTSPWYIFDAIELFSNITNSSDFEASINKIFKIHDIYFSLKNNKIYPSNNFISTLSNIKKCQEIGLERLLIDANKFYSNGDFDIATEKIWDAFERIKTHYYPTLDKRHSANKIVKDISLGCSEIEKEFNEEFKKLTEVGNNFRIRHHEKNKTDIIDKRHYDYLYKRCLALITTVIDFLDIE